MCLLCMTNGNAHEFNSLCNARQCATCCFVCTVTSSILAEAIVSVPVQFAVHTCNSSCSRSRHLSYGWRSHGSRVQLRQRGLVHIDGEHRGSGMGMVADRVSSPSHHRCSLEAPA